MTDRTRHVSMALLLSGIVLCGAESRAQTASAPVSAAPPPSARAYDLSSRVERRIAFQDALQLYINCSDATPEQFDAPIQLLHQLVQADPNYIPAQYYLGLSYMRQGIGRSTGLTADENAFIESQPEAERVAVRQRVLAERQGKARESFTAAKVHLRFVYESFDKTTTPFDAALNLAISQLGATAIDVKGDPEIKKRLDLTRETIETLKKYVATPEGLNDGYGWFYLGVATFRQDLFSETTAQLSQCLDHFHQARTRFEQGAFTAEERASLGGTISYYEGNVYALKRETDKARAKLEEVANSEHNLKFAAQDTLVLLNKTRTDDVPRIAFPAGPGHIELEGVLSIGNLYDSNVSLLGEDTIPTPGISRKGDYRFELGYGAEVSYVLRDSQDKEFRIGVGGFNYNGWHPSINEYNLNQYLGGAYTSYELLRLDNDSMYGRFDYVYSYTLLDQSGFISSNRLSPSLNYVWRGDYRDEKDQDLAITRAFYIYEDRDYLDYYTDPRLDRDGNYHNVGVVQYFNHLKNRDIWKSWYDSDAHRDARDKTWDGAKWLTTRVGYSYRNERTQGDEFDLWANAIIGGITVPLPARFTFDFQASFSWDNYTQPSVFDYRRKERFDFVQTYDLALSYIVIPKGHISNFPSFEMVARGVASFTIEDSNIWNRSGEDIYQYDRGVYGLQLIMNF